MRTLRIVLLLVSRALTGGAMLAAQAVERTDVPARGVLRVTFDPRIMTWNDEFTAAGRLKLGAPLTGDTVGGRYIPVVARLEQNVRVASGLAGFVAGLGAAFEPRCQPRREPAGGEHAGDTREGLGVLRAIRHRAGPAGPTGRGMCAAPVPLRGAGQLGALAWRARCAARRRVRCGADRLAVPAARHVDRRPGHR